jgi:hypothetical protein
MSVTNTRGVIATLFPASTSEAQLYAVPAGTVLDGVLRISNQDAEESSYRIAHCPAAHGDNAATNTDWVAYDVAIAAVGGAPHEYSIHAKATETIRVKAGTASKITFHLSGNKEVTT